MQIGSVRLENNVILAPMAGVCDLPFRRIAKEMGCGLVVAEMVSDKGLIYGNEHTLEMLAIDPAERPLSIQIFGSEPKIMAKAAQIVEEHGADIIDINMGCPTPKIVKNGEGSALMRNPQLAYEIVAAVVAAVKVPVTVKMRTGWDHSHLNAPDIAKLAEQAGASAVAVHGRTREQFYTGKADWDMICKVKEAVKIPVIGNGDIWRPEDAAQMLEQTGCDAVMIGRGAQGNPWIFREVTHYLKTGQLLEAPTIAERLSVIERHFDDLVAFKGEYVGIREMRKHAAWYTHGLPHAAELRKRFNQAETKADFLQVMDHLACEEE